jgi:Fe-S oxidoreductase
MLERAKQLLRKILETLREEIAGGIPVVVLEPSCLAVFRDEMTNLFPADEDAKRLSQQTFALAEFLENRTENYQPPKLARKALVHGHCHQKALMKMEAEKSLLSKMEADFEILDSGCCGMAGSFGFEKEHYEVSMKVGELVLLPAVREAAEDTLIIADGFSCREQIAQATNRQALHLAEAIRLAMG